MTTDQNYYLAKESSGVGQHQIYFFPNLLSSSFELLLFTQKKSRLFIITNFDFIYCLNYRTASLIMKIGLFFGSFYLQLKLHSFKKYSTCHHPTSMKLFMLILRAFSFDNL